MKSRFVHSIYTCMATTGPLGRFVLCGRICFVLFGHKTMVLHILCVYKSLRPTLSTTPFIPTSGLSSSEDRFLAVHLSSRLLLSRFTWLVLRVLIPFTIILSRCFPSHSLLPYTSLLR